MAWDRREAGENTSERHSFAIITITDFFKTDIQVLFKCWET